MASFNTVVGVFSVVGLTLIFALAYNIGSTAEESRSMKMGSITKNRMDVLRERLTLCLGTNKDADHGRVNKESMTSFLQETNKLLQTENNMFREQNQEGLMMLRECQTHLDTIREEHTGTREVNATHMIEHLEEEKMAVEDAIGKANQTREHSRSELRSMIEAYRIEIGILSKVLHVKQRDALRRARAAKLANEKVTFEGSTALAADLVDDEVVGEYLRKEEAEDEAAAAQANVQRSPNANDAADRTPAVDDEAPSCSNGKKQYSVVFDAGSTGSRVHVFHFFKGSDGSLHLSKEDFHALKPGLSSFADDPQAAADSLQPLLKTAVEAVPSDFYKCTPIALKATAGLRLIGEEKSARILEAVDKLFRASPFVVGQIAVELMDGKDEGPYAWLTVNFLLGNLAKGRKTAAILDMGGGSTQIVFAPDSPDVLDGAPGEHVYAATIRGTPLKAYQHSYLGLGLKEAAKAIVKRAPEASGSTFPCVAGETEIGGAVVKNGESADFAACTALLRKYVVVPHSDESACPRKPCAFNGVYQPSLSGTFSGPVYAFSYFHELLEGSLPESGEITVGTFREAAKRACGQNDADKPTHCLDLSFVYTLLHDGYGLSDDQPLIIKKKINDIETAWPLGAALAAMEDRRH